MKETQDTEEARGRVRTVSELAALVEGETLGDGSVSITGVAGLEHARPGQLSFYGNRKYKAQLERTKASAVLVGRSEVAAPNYVAVRVDNPALAFAKVAHVFLVRRAVRTGIASQASVDPGAVVDPTASVAPFAVVSRGASVGPRCVVGPGCFLGEDVQVGADSVLVSNVSILHGCRVGARCFLHSGVVVGADGFGFVFDPSVPMHVKVPQTGIVRIEDDVEIGANSCIDRATTGETVVGRGTKIDNLVQIGHNCVVGPMSILCAQVGLSGSTELGVGVVLAGQAGTAGHLRIGDMAKVGAQSGVIVDVEEGTAVLGSPSMEARAHMKSRALFARLPELHKTIRDLERRLKALEQERDKP